LGAARKRSTAVHVKTMESQELRLLLTNRKMLLTTRSKPSASRSVATAPPTCWISEKMTAQESPRTTKLYDGMADMIMLKVKRVLLLVGI
jgi:hypothetical protein